MTALSMLEIRRRVLLHQTQSGGLPSGYTAISSIVSSGGARIRLPAIAFAEGDSIKTSVKLQYLGTTTNNFWLAGDGYSKGGVQYEYGRWNGWWWTNNAFSNDVITLTLSDGTANAVIEGEWEHIYASSASNFTFDVLQRFGFTATDERKAWYVKLYKNGTLLYDLTPCIRNSDNAVGMYELVNGIFYGNSGNGTLSAGTE